MGDHAGAKRIGRQRPVVVPDDLWAAIAAIGTRDGVSGSVVVRNALRHYVELPAEQTRQITDGRHATSCTVPGCEGTHAAGGPVPAALLALAPRSRPDG